MLHLEGRVSAQTEILLHERYVYSLSFVNVFISVWTHRWLLYTLDYNPILVYFVAYIVLALAMGSPPSLKVL